MDLFTLVAKLTIDKKDYEKELKKAEQKAKGARVDITGEIRANDHYTDAVTKAAHAAQSFDGDAEGTIIADDQYSKDLSAAEGNARNAALDADGDLTADDQYSDVLSTAETDASGADLDAEGDIELNDEYSDDLSAAESDVENADLDAEGSVTVDTDDVEPSLTEASDQVDGFIEGIQKKLKAAGIVAAAVGIGAALKRMVMGSAEYADTVDKQSQALAISRTEYQKWDHALSQSGASMATVTRGFRNLAAAIGGDMTEDIAGAFEALKINPSDYKTTEDLFDAVITSLAAMDEGADRNNLVDAIFGRSGTQLNALLNSGVDGIKDLRQEAEDLGLVMSDEDIANGVAFGDAFANMQAAVGALKNKVSSELFPVLTEAIGMVTDLVTSPETTEFITRIGNAFRSIFDSLGFFDEEGHLQLPDWLKTGLDLVATVLEGISTVIDWIAAKLGVVKRAATPSGVTRDPDAEDRSRFTDPGAASEYFSYNGKSYLVRRGEMGIDGKYVPLTEDEFQYYEFGGPLVLKTPSGSGNISKAEYDAALAAMQATLNDDGSADYEARGVPWNQFRLERGGETGQWIVPAGDTGIGWENMIGMLEKVLGRALEIDEVNNLIHSGLTLNDKLDSAEMDISTATVDGNVVTVNGAKWDLSNIILKLGTEASDGSFAKGAWDIPYDDFVANLHRGEMVLTASEARDYREGNGWSSDAVVAAIQRLSNEMQNLKIVVGKKVFGQTVVDYGGKRMNNYIGKAEDKAVAGYGWG